MARPGPPGRLGSGAVPGWAKGLSPLPLSLGRPWHMGFLIARYPIAFSFYHGFFPCQGLPAGNFPWAPSPPLCQGGPAARCAAGPSGAFPLFPRGEDAVFRYCSATSFLRNWDSILEKKRANLRSISEPARLRQPPPRSTGAAHARGRAQSIREERRIAAPPVLFALLWVRLLPALYGPFCGPLRPFGGCPWGVTPPARECLPPAPPDTRRRG